MHSTTRAQPVQHTIARRMTALEQLRAEKKAWRIPQLIIGLLGYGFSLTLLVHSQLGASSWSVLAEGIALHSGLSFGWTTNLIAVFVLLCWIPLRELPGLGTVLNVLLIGVSADIGFQLIAAPTTFPGQLAHFTLGVLLLTFADAVYLGARFGSGPRDGLMTGAVRYFDKPVWLVRLVLELVVLGAGWLLGGTVGFGTVLIAVCMGPMVQWFLRFTTVRLRGDGPADQNTVDSGKPFGEGTFSA